MSENGFHCFGRPLFVRFWKKRGVTKVPSNTLNGLHEEKQFEFPSHSPLVGMTFVNDLNKVAHRFSVYSLTNTKDRRFEWLWSIWFVRASRSVTSSFVRSSLRSYRLMCSRKGTNDLRHPLVQAKWKLQVVLGTLPIHCLTFSAVLLIICWPL